MENDPHRKGNQIAFGGMAIFATHEYFVPAAMLWISSLIL